MTNKFHQKKAYFESKSMIAPNSLIFHKQMSETAKILILALHAIATCAPNWIVIQEDLRVRLGGWGREKMDNAISCSVKFGYLKVIQSRNKTGKFLHNEFIFDIDGQLLSYKDDETNPGLYDLEEELKECLPKTGFPTTANPTSANPTLPISLNEPDNKKQQQHSQHPPPFVVVFDSLKKLDIDEDLCKDLCAEYSDFDVNLGVERTLKSNRENDAAFLRWVLKNPEKWAEPKVNDPVSNKELAIRIEKSLIAKGDSFIDAYPDCVCTDRSNPIQKNMLPYDSKGFREQLDSALRKKNTSIKELNV